MPFHSRGHVFKVWIYADNALIEGCRFFYPSDRFEGARENVLQIDDFIWRCGLVAQGSPKRLDGCMMLPYLRIAEPGLCRSLETVE